MSQSGHFKGINVFNEDGKKIGRWVCDPMADVREFAAVETPQMIQMLGRDTHIRVLAQEANRKLAIEYPDHIFLSEGTHLNSEGHTVYRAYWGHKHHCEYVPIEEQTQ